MPVICETYETNTLQEYKFVVTLSFYRGRILLGRHRKRTTWETQGGHIEEGETPLEAAKRELYEECGAVEYDIRPLCDYRAGNPEKNDVTNGMVFTAQIQRLGPMPESEIAEIKEFDVLPENLTYPAITPVLFAELGCYLYRRATSADLEELVQTRIKVLRAANELSEDTDLTTVEQESRKYYQTALENGGHTAWLIYDKDRFIGAGGISFYKVMPTFHNSDGRKAYIMNMYTDPQYRRKGIAMQTLKLLVAEAHDKGIRRISLEATKMGRPLYEKFGFVPMQEEMELPDL